MAQQKVTITKGLPASGKSTWAKKKVRESQGKTKRINKDDLRAMLDNSKFSKKSEKFIEQARNILMGEALSLGYNVIIDDTNLNPRQIKDIKTYIDIYKLDSNNINNNNIEIIIKDFTGEVTLEECLRRNALREGLARVPDDVIHRMYNKWLKDGGTK
jgi:predicted kinase